MNSCDCSQSVIGCEIGQEGRELSSALIRQVKKDVSIPSALVVSDNDFIGKTLTEILLSCGVVPVFANSIERADQNVAAGDISFVISQDILRDGSYTDLIGKQTARGRATPLIVVSLTGDWPEFLEALDRGAYDFLRYPLLPGELPRIIRHLLDEPRG